MEDLTRGYCTSIFEPPPSHDIKMGGMRREYERKQEMGEMKR
jgi:hypothetical protein